MSQSRWQGTFLSHGTKCFPQPSFEPRLMERPARALKQLRVVSVSININLVQDHDDIICPRLFYFY